MSTTAIAFLVATRPKNVHLRGINGPMFKLEPTDSATPFGALDKTPKLGGRRGKWNGNFLPITEPSYFYMTPTPNGMLTNRRVTQQFCSFPRMVRRSHVKMNESTQPHAPVCSSFSRNRNGATLL
eukprot:GHVU01229623.1.p1 GENE.GHVU01229623.1~~GHVU01229623.1.p1  ORF type:complete len:125 (+),score=6.62 GHVU01229623.1:795-1169(+)